MNYIRSLSVVFPILAALLLFGIWGSVQTYGQPVSLSAADRSGGTIISPEVKAIMCAPDNPSLKVVNTTEANICGIPKTVKSTPATSPVSSSQQTTRQVANNIVATPSKQQQQIIATSNNAAATIRNAPVKQLSSTTIRPTIAPQANLQQQQQEQQPLQPHILPLTAASNNTITLNNTLATASPLLTQGKLTFLGFHGSDSSSSDNGGGSGGSGSSHSSKHSSDTKSSSSSNNEHSSDTKSSHSDSSSSHKTSSDTHHSSKSESGSSIRDKVHSIIRHALD